MVVLITDESLAERLKNERHETGADRFDEVWEGTYMMTPMPNEQHQQLATRFGAVLQFVVGWEEADKVYVGINVSDREIGWEHNYRVPDVAVFLRGSQAKNCGTHWLGGPDFVVEITSPDDRTRDKLPFCSQIGVRELLLVDRDRWNLELYQLKAGQLLCVSQSSLAQSAVLTSNVLPLTFRLVPGKSRPQIEVVHRDGERSWLV